MYISSLVATLVKLLEFHICWEKSVCVILYYLLFRLYLCLSTAVGGLYLCFPFLSLFSSVVSLPSSWISASVVHSEPTISLLRTKEERELVCLVFGYSPANISITWLKNSIVVEAADQQTSPPSRGPDGKFSVHSHFNMSANDWNSWIKFTCSVSHKTGQWSVSISKPGATPHLCFLYTYSMSWHNNYINCLSYLFLGFSIYNFIHLHNKTRHTDTHTNTRTQRNTELGMTNSYFMSWFHGTIIDSIFFAIFSSPF